MVHLSSSSIAVIVLAALMTTGTQFANAAPNDLLDNILGSANIALAAEKAPEADVATKPTAESMWIGPPSTVNGYGDSAVKPVGLGNPMPIPAPVPAPNPFPGSQSNPATAPMPPPVPVFPGQKPPCKKNKDTVLAPVTGITSSGIPEIAVERPMLPPGVTGSGIPEIAVEGPMFPPGVTGSGIPEIAVEGPMFPPGDTSSPKRRNCDKKRLNKADNKDSSYGDNAYASNPVQKPYAMPSSVDTQNGLGDLLGSAMANGSASDANMSVVNAVAEDVKGLSDEQLSTLLTQSVVSKSSAGRMSSMQPAIVIAGALAAMMMFF